MSDAVNVMQTTATPTIIKTTLTALIGSCDPSHLVDKDVLALPTVRQRDEHNQERRDRRGHHGGSYQDFVGVPLGIVEVLVEHRITLDVHVRECEEYVYRRKGHNERQREHDRPYLDPPHAEATVYKDSEYKPNG